MTARRRLLCLLAILDGSPLPMSDPVRLELEGEILERLAQLRVMKAARAGRLFGASQPLPVA